MTSTAGPRLAVSWMDHPAFAATMLPLLEGGELDALEWSFDTAWRPSAATAAVLDAFASAGRLYGHGVRYSTLSADDRARQDRWLARLRAEVGRRAYNHVSEHLGFVTAGDRLDGAPLPLPAWPEVVRTGRDALARLADAAGVPVGLENLALALSPDDVDAEGDLLDALLEPVDGFVLLDLHNLWCRAVNQRRDPVALLDRYPASRVRELHVSGGSWNDGFRRDTHDDGVPDDVMALIQPALARFPGVEVVVLEQLPGALVTEGQQARFRADLTAIRERVEDGWTPLAVPTRASTPLPSPPTPPPSLVDLQERLLDALEHEPDGALAARRLEPLAPLWVGSWDPRAARVAAELVKKWTVRR